jgi:hypothetical protein
VKRGMKKVKNGGCDKKKRKEWNENIMEVLYRCDADPGKTKTPDSPAINQVWT